jgi:5-methylcytosine-specific restriction endonuclease McrA
LTALLEEIARTRSKIDQRTAELKANGRWWQKLLCTPKDALLDGNLRSLFALQAKQRNLEEEHSRLESRMENAKKVRKRYLDAQIARNAAEARHQLKLKDHEKLCAASIADLDNQFERTRFLIQRKDYRRGNLIDNYCRNTLSDRVLKAFENSCVFCGGHSDLTFDHYAITKNEGGNFVLISSDKSSIRPNIVVLCRGCNAAKAERPYMLYFNPVMRERIATHQKVFLETLLPDEDFLTLVKKWTR